LCLQQSHLPSRKPTLIKTTIRICPRRNVREVGRRCVAEDTLCPSPGIILHQSSGYVSNSLMSKSAPGVRPGAEKRQQSQRSVHVEQTRNRSKCNEAAIHVQQRLRVFNISFTPMPIVWAYIIARICNVYHTEYANRTRRRSCFISTLRAATGP
jgi:hypothetical protein